MALSDVLRTFLNRSMRPDAMGLPHQGPHWLGRPLLITENSDEVDLRNGSVGLVVERPRGDAGDGELVAVFPGDADAPRYLALARLPAHDTALAMTVHKSQGSEFDRLALVLPADATSPILTRELIYTALTRARWQVHWFGEPGVLRRCLGRRVERASGLAELLWPTDQA